MKPSERINEIERKWDRPLMLAGERAYAFTQAILEYLDEQAKLSESAAGRREPERPLSIRHGVADLMVDELAKQYQKALIYGSKANRWRNEAHRLGSTVDDIGVDPLGAEACTDEAALKFARETLRHAWLRQGDTEEPELEAELSALKLREKQLLGQVGGLTERVLKDEAELAEAKGRIEELERRSVSEETLRKLAGAMNDLAQKKRYSPHYNWHEDAKAELCEAAKVMLDSSTPGGVLQGESKPEKIG